MNRVRTLIADLTDADWILDLAKAAQQSGAKRPTPARLRRALLRIKVRDDLYSDADRAKAEAWRMPS